MEYQPIHGRRVSKIDAITKLGRNVLRKLPPVRNVDGKRNTLRPYDLMV